MEHLIYLHFKIKAVLGQIKNFTDFNVKPLEVHTSAGYFFILCSKLNEFGAEKQEQNELKFEKN